MGIVQRTDDDGIVVLTMDDGKLNALDADVFRELNAAFDDASDAAAIVLAGRENAFTAGLNTKKLPDLGREGVAELLEGLGRTVLRIWLEPRPVVAACTGHAIAAGTMLAMACDHAVAAEGDFRWGLTETQIGFPLPDYAIRLARGNVRNDRVDDLLLPGAVVDAATAVEVGFADELVAPAQVLSVALGKARQLAELSREVYALTKKRLRGEAADAALVALEADVKNVLEGGGL